MAQEADGTIVIDTKIDKDGLEKGIKGIHKSTERLNNALTQASKSMANAYNNIHTDKAEKKVNALKQTFESTNVAIEKAKDKMVKLEESYNAILNGNTTPKSIIAMEKELEKIDKEYMSIREQVKAIESESTSLQGDLSSGILRPNEVAQAQSRLKYLAMEYSELGTKSESLYMRSEELRAKLEELKLNPSLTKEAQDLNNKIEIENQNMGVLVSKVDNLGSKFEDAGNEADNAFNKASKGANKTRKSTMSAGKSLQHLGVRLKNIVLGALVFNAISAGLTTLRKQLSSMLKTNATVNSQLSDIKGNLLTAFQPIYEAVLPALQSFLGVLKTVSSYLAEFTSLLFGKTVQSSSAAAEALWNQANATEAAGDAAKKALGSYDKLNVISQDTASASSSSTSPTFNTTSASNGLIGNLASAIKNGDWSNVGDMFGNGIKWCLEHITDFVKNINWSKIGDNLVDFISGMDLAGIALDIIDLTVSILDGATEFVLGAGLSVADWISQGLGLGSIDITVDELKIEFKKANYKAHGFLGTLFTAIDEHKNPFDIWFQDTWETTKTLWEYLGYDVDSLLGTNDDTTWKEAIGKIFSIIFSLDTLKGFWKASKNTMKQFFTDTVPEGLDLFKQTLIVFWTQRVPGTLSSGWSIFTAAFKAFWTQRVPSFFSGFGNSIGGWFTKIFTNASDNIKKIFNNIPSYFSGVFGRIQTTFKNLGIKIGDTVGGAFKSVINSVLAKVESTLNSAFGFFNTALKTINKLPGVNIGKIANITLPRLATGAVIPANSEFMAVLGDQKHGTNIEAPLDTIKQALREVETEGGNTNGDINLYVDGEKWFTWSRKKAAEYKNRYGKPAYS